jgi:tetratricopeptide (TPR) repeat protein
VFNAGDALYKLDRDSDAAGAFDSVAARRDAPQELRAAALYNLGNARYSAGDYAAAADAYRRSLAVAPGDTDARRNLVLALLRQKNPPPKPPPPQPRPQDSMTREDAERVMRAVSEREKAAQRQAPPPAGLGQRRPPASPAGEDW